MDKNDAQIDPDDGLKLQGPLTGQISTIKVKFFMEYTMPAMP